MDFHQSVALYERARASLAGGVSTVMRADVRPVPLFIDRADGAWLHDVDGNRLIDYALGFGPLILGHRHPAIIEAVTEQLARGLTYGAQHRLETELAEMLIAAVPSAERVLFSSTGTEAVQVALRLARAATDRSKFVKFEGHYHGWLDSVLLSYRGAIEALGPRSQPTATQVGKGYAPGAVSDTLVLPWNDLNAVASLLSGRASEIAAVILEPIMCNSGGILPAPGYLEGLRTLCDRYGVVLIFDEVITGFRIAYGGAQEYFGVTPDLTVLGKAIAGGFPLSAVVGRSDLIDQVADRSVVHAGTFNGYPLSLAASVATLSVLGDRADPPYPNLHRRGDSLRSSLTSLLEGLGVDVVAAGLGPAFTLSMGLTSAPTDYRDYLKADLNAYADFAEAALRNGVFLMPRGMWYISTAHADDDLSYTLERIEMAARSSLGVLAQVDASR